MSKPELLDLVNELWEEVLGEAPSAPDADFFDDGGTSLSAVSLTFLLEDRSGVPVPLAVLLSDGTPEGLARHLAAA
ncbi:acyl carrier protein [Streptomyces sp. NPDC090025]|uniref:acyl carrier protein n=1 Tax=Streptomyces sp. NPDC090025 TaxID=3365922 RepID=UPI003839BD60